MCGARAARVDNGGMDAPPLSSDPRAELAALRRRAYGPHADIHEDAAALARLNALEDAVRAEEDAAAHRDRAIRAAEWNPGRDESPVSTNRPTQAAAAAPAAPATPKVWEVGVSPEPGVEEQPSESATVAPVAARARWWRRLPRWAPVVLAGVIGLIVGLLGPTLMPPFPETTLHKVGPIGADAPVDEEMGMMFGADEGSAQLYESFRGLDVWTVTSEESGRCLAVTDDGAWLGAGCAGEPLTVYADVRVYAGQEPEVLAGDLAEGSLIRFELRGDSVDVWIVEAEEAA